MAGIIERLGLREIDPDNLPPNIELVEFAEVTIFNPDGVWRVKDLEPLAARPYPDIVAGKEVCASDPRPCVVCGAEHPWDGLHPVACPECKDVPVRPGTRHRRPIGWPELQKEAREARND